MLDKDKKDQREREEAIEKKKKTAETMGVLNW